MSADRTRPAAEDGFQGTEFRALDACHQQIAQYLGYFGQLLTALDADGVTPATQTLAKEIEAFFSSTAQQHHADEEQRVFPPLLASPDAELVAAVKRLQQDHGFIEENWIELAPQLRALAAGYNWYDLPTLQQGARVFIDLLNEHIELEESLIYPQAKAMWAEMFAQRARRQQQAAQLAT
jgi:hemerythrin-like domain-containing protein